MLCPAIVRRDWCANVPSWEDDLSNNTHAAPRALPPHVQLIQMGTAFWVSRVVYAAAKLGLADQLAAGPKNAAELAGLMQVHAPSLHRLMRTMASLGLLTERPGQRFALTALGEALKTGVRLRKVIAAHVRQPLASKFL